MATTSKSTHVEHPRTFGEATKRFTDAGFAPSELLPLAPFDADVADNFRHAKENGSLGKAPGRYLPGSRKWVGLQGPHLTEGLNENVQREARHWPTPNVGVCSRHYPAIDCDVNSEDARRLVERAVCTVLGAFYAERVRGDGPRRLYAFRSKTNLDPSRQIRKSTWEFRLRDDAENAPSHKVDILGTGQQFVAAGIHPNGDLYGWDKKRGLHAVVEADEIERADIEKLRVALEAEVRKVGGTWVRASSSKITDGGKLYDYTWDNPIAEPGRIIDALWKMPNSEANFPLHDDLVEVLAAIHAALGSAAVDPEIEDQVREWAVDSSDGWCREKEDYEKVWNSLRRGVKCGRDRLLVRLRKHGVRDLDGIDFPDDAAAIVLGISEHKAAEKAESAAKNAPLLARAVEAYVFHHLGTVVGKRGEDPKQKMRPREYPNRLWNADDWWKGKIPDPNKDILKDLQSEYIDKQTGLADFLLDLEKAYPFAFVSRVIKDPRYDYGEVVRMYDTRKKPAGALNLRQRSQAQNVAEKPGRVIDHVQAKADVARVLDFFERGFGSGEVKEYVLDTLAFMVQKTQRPGHMLIIEGEQGVGKSLFSQFATALLDGVGEHIAARIDGSKLMDRNSFRFGFSAIEGARCVPIKELPDATGMPKTSLKLVEAILKSMVDGGTEGDYVGIEGKGVDIKQIANHAWFIATTNYENTLPIPPGDRRYLVVRWGITQANKPSGDFYERVADIMHDPERLAVVWDYLKARAIGHYNPHKPPPVTAEKVAAQYRSMVDPVRHMAVAYDTLVHAGRSVVTLADIVPLMNLAGRIEAKENGDWDGERDLYRVGKPVAGAVAGTGPSPVPVRALVWLGEKTRKSEKKVGRGAARTWAPTVYALKGSRVPIEDMQWPALSDLLGQERERHPLREGVQVMPYDAPIEPMPPVVDRIAGQEDDDNGADPDSPDSGNVVSIDRRRRA